MATKQQRKKWSTVALMMLIGVIVGMIGVIRSADIPDIAVWIMCVLGFGSFLAGFVALVMGTSNK